MSRAANRLFNLKEEKGVRPLFCRGCHVGSKCGFAKKRGLTPFSSLAAAVILVLIFIASAAHAAVEIRLIPLPACSSPVAR